MKYHKKTTIVISSLSGADYTREVVKLRRTAAASLSESPSRISSYLRTKRLMNDSCAALNLVNARSDTAE